MPLLLALDASLARCSAALLRMEDGGVIAESALDIAQGQPARLPELAAEVLAASGGEALAAVAAVVGPGSFTGIRTALALARGLALASGAPCVGVTTGEALAAALPEAGEVWAALDTRRGAVFLERLREGRAVGPPDVVRPAERVPGPGVTLAGDAAPLLPLSAGAMLSPMRLPRAGDAGRAALRRLRGELPPIAPRPLYVEPPAVRTP